jgi:anthranilate phosphoribosyltransferase
MGTQNAIALHGREKLDEAGLAEETDLALLSAGEVRLSTLNPQKLGLTPAPTVALRGGNVEENAMILAECLARKGDSSAAGCGRVECLVSAASGRYCTPGRATKLD